MKEYREISIEIDEGVLTVRLNRPKTFNSLTLKLWSELGDALHAAEADGAVRCVIIRGSGGNFSSGYDFNSSLEAFDGAAPHVFRDYLDIGTATCWKIWRLKKPVIAAVEGYCLGGGFEMAMACDFVISTSAAKFGEPEIRLSDAPPFLISPWVMSMRAVKDLLLTGDLIDAERADKFGLLTAIHEPSKFEAELSRMARKMSAYPTGMWSVNKTAINRTFEIQGLQSAIEMGMDMFAAANTYPNDFKNEFIARLKADGFKSALGWAQSRYET